MKILFNSLLLSIYVKLRKSFMKRKLGEGSSYFVFKKIYQNNFWNSSESISGTGSETIQTYKIVNELKNLFLNYDIKSILDLPCGDFGWMKNVDLTGISYLGGDIVDDLIKVNCEKFRIGDNINFKTINMITDSLPYHDLILVRDCFVHLSYADIFKSVKNLKASGSKYLLTTSFTEYRRNFDIITGDWRRLNFEIHPFNFPTPIFVLNENCTEGNGKFYDKSLVLWDLQSINI